MKEKIVVGIIGAMVMLLSACGSEEREEMVVVEEVAPSDTSIGKNESEAEISSDSYREIYEQVISGMEGEGIIFSLIYLDNDEIPELAICDRGYGTYSVYTVKDGSAFCMLDAMTTVEMSYFERKGILASFARWNGGGDEGGYGWYYYQVSADKALVDGDLPILHFTYDATYDEEGNWTGEGVTRYYHLDQEIDETGYQKMLNDMGITEGNGKPCVENALEKEEILDQLGKREEGQIVGQSFEAELYGFGKVIFAPFEPVSYPSVDQISGSI